VIFLKILKISKKKLDFFNIFDIYIEHLHIYGSELDCIRFFQYFRYISSICTYMVLNLTVSTAVLLLSLLGS